MTTLESDQFPGAGPDDCPDTCSMVVTADDGRVTKVRGNPDRLLHPLRRVGDKGQGRFDEITLDESSSCE